MIKAILTMFLSLLYLSAALYYAAYVWQKGAQMRERERQGKRRFKEYLRSLKDDK